MSNESHLVTADDGMRHRKASLVEIQDPDGRRRTVQLDELTEADRALAAEFGYKPVFKREFGYLSTFSFAVSISGLFATTATTFVAPLTAGGSASVVWCWLISGAGCMCIALSVAELVSAYPTCGGLYYTVSRLAPKRYVPQVSWVTGWLNLLGQVAGVASSEWGSASLLLAAVAMNSGVDPETGAFNYVPTYQETCGVMAALTVFTGLVNSLSTYWMEKMTKTYVIFHIAVLLTGSIALLAMPDNPDLPMHNSASYVFTNVTNMSGWTPDGWSFLLGFLSVSWTMTDYDATAHITEEINEPEIKAPWAISMAMLFTYVVGWLYNIVLCFRMGNPFLGDPETDPANKLGIFYSPLVQPVAQIYYNNLGRVGGIVFTVCAFIILQFVCFTATQALARTVFAFSRDRLLPLSSVWVKIFPLTGTPILAVWICIFFCIAINLIGLGSYTAILGVFNVCAIALDWSYCLPIACKMLFGQFKPGPWHLGKYSFWINAWGLIWTAFVSIVFVMPTIIPATPENMNYAVVYLAGILAFAYIYWFLFGRRYYTGPLIEAEVADESDSNLEAPDDTGVKGEHHTKIIN